MLPGFRRTLFNLGSLWSGKVVTILASFLITGLSTRYFGLEKMGVWLLAVNAASYILLFDFGASSALPRILPALHVQGKKEKINSLLRTTYTASWGVALIGCAVCAFFFSSDLRSLVTLGDGSAETALIYALAFGFAFVGLPYRAGFGLLAAVHRFDLFSFLDMAGMALKVLFVVALVYFFEGGFVAYAVGALAIPLAANFFQYRMGLGLNKADLRGGKISKNSFALVLAHCGPSLAITFASMLLIQGTTLLAGTQGAAQAVIYGYPLQLVLNAMSFSASISGLLSPVASALYGGGERKKIIHIALRSVRMASALSVVIALLLLMAGPWLIRIWLGGPKIEPEALEQMTIIMSCLAMGNIFLTPGLVLKGMFLGMDKQVKAAAIELGGALAGLLVGWMLMRFAGLGLMGIVIGTILSYVLRGFVIFPFCAARDLDFSLSRLLFQGVGVPVLIGLVAWGGAESVLSLGDGADLILRAFAGGAIVSLVWGAGAWLFVLDQEIKDRIWTYLEKKGVFKRKS